MAEPTREEMIAYLRDHFRYYTMNSWNISTSYARNVKINNLDLTSAQRDKAYDIIHADDAFYEINNILESFGVVHDYKYQLGFNGRSGGYIVMIPGGYSLEGFDFKPEDPEDRQDYCDRYGWLSHKEARERGIAYAQYKKVYTQPGPGIDMDADYEDWDDDYLKSRYKLVKEFDSEVDDCISVFKEMVDSCNVIEKEIMVPKKVRVLECAGRDEDDE